MSKIDLARALKDQTYFDSLSEEEKALVRKANPVGEPNLNDQDLDSVSGGLGGGAHPESTTTTTDLPSCTCSDTPPVKGVASPSCTCAC